MKNCKKKHERLYGTSRIKNTNHEDPLKKKKYHQMKMNILHPGMLSCCSLVRLCATLFTVARQAPLSMGFSRQEHCCHALLWGSFPTQGSNPHLSRHLHWQMDSLPLAPPGKPQRIQTLMGKGTFQPQGLWEHQDSNAALDQEYSMVILQLRHLWDTVPQTWDARVRGIPG